MVKRQHIINSIIFTAIIVVVVAVVNWIIETGVKNSRYSYYNKVNLVANHKIEPQIAVFGSSVGETNINAPLIQNACNKSVFNFSFDGTRFAQYRGLISELNKYSDSTQLFILAETFFSLTNINQLTEVDRFITHLDKQSIYEPLHQIQPNLIWKSRYVPFYKFIVVRSQYYKAAALGWKSALRYSNEIDTTLGFNPKNIPWESWVDAQNAKGVKIRAAVDSQAVADYCKTIKELESKGRKVLIVATPIYHESRRLITNIDDLLKTFKSFESRNVTFLDYSESSLSNDKKWFYNNTHLNRDGAEEFTKMLLKDIQTAISVPKK